MTEQERPLIALVSAVQAAIPPAEAAFAELFPAARVWNILDDHLLQAAAGQRRITPDLANRMGRLVRHALAGRADGILLTCSLYGPVAHDLARTVSVPLLAPDDALFAAVLDGGHRRVLLLSPAAGPLADSAARLATAADSAGAELAVTGAVAEGAADAARDRDHRRLVSLLHRAYLDHGAETDAIVLGQYSISPVATDLADLTGRPVLAGPRLAALALRDAVGQREADA
ncbi:hypothetical protein GA0074692_0455 [Micromonospora pallida]|uniref:Asp/Glu/Hydantoin racemase n=1 Tax=Micromonospora pallida TaxID=145854 RepID=A0A1C6RNE4_9ACTN|nr:aspartate/glutamate racemase family protein [Micromonospora pallida]SCL18698.1 hypothetical protein GA0074692_0455 [Micromonospora pallida]